MVRLAAAERMSEALDGGNMSKESDYWGDVVYEVWRRGERQT